jgi:hypothetical protein
VAKGEGARGRCREYVIYDLGPSLNMEPGTWNPERGTRNLEPGTWNPEQET